MMMVLQRDLRYLFKLVKVSIMKSLPQVKVHPLVTRWKGRKERARLTMNKFQTTQTNQLTKKI